MVGECFLFVFCFGDVDGFWGNEGVDDGWVIDSVGNNNSVGWGWFKKVWVGEVGCV